MVISTLPVVIGLFILLAVVFQITLSLLIWTFGISAKKVQIREYSIPVIHLVFGLVLASVYVFAYLIIHSSLQAAIIGVMFLAVAMVMPITLIEGSIQRRLFVFFSFLAVLIILAALLSTVFILFL